MIDAALGNAGDARGMVECERPQFVARRPLGEIRIARSDEVFLLNLSEPPAGIGILKRTIARLT